VAGTAYGVDRLALAAGLGFHSVSRNSLDAVADRDFAVESLFTAALIGVHLSRMAEGLILFSSREFGFVDLGDAHVTGSSLMPQKANPDPLELARGKAGRLIGNLAGLLSTLKGLPSAYDKDLQEDKEAIFDAHDTLAAVLPAMSALIGGLSIHHERMLAAIPAAVFATDLADHLVEKGIPFREAHRAVSEAVRLAETRGESLREFPLDAYRDISRAFEEDLYQVFDVERSLARCDNVGGTGPQAVRQQLLAAKQLLDES
jgi:argininosuccinate lyase